MKPKGLLVDKDSPDFKKMLELSADDSLLASVDQGKRKFFTYLKNKLTPIQENQEEKLDKSEHKCQQFETATLLTKTEKITGSEDAKDVSQKNMPTTVQLPSTNLNNIESSSSQTNTNNLQSLGKWNTTPEHLKQITTNIEKQQQQQTHQPPKENQQPTKSVQSNTKHHLPPITRKTILGPVPQARSSISHSHHLSSKEPLQANTNYRAIYQPTNNNLMASYISSNGQEWIVTKQRIQRPQDHNILTLNPVVNNHFVQKLPLTDAEIRKQEFIERKIAQEKYRQQLEHQILQQKPVKPFKPRTTLKFDGEAEFKTETRQNYKPFRFVTSLNDLDKKGLGNDKTARKQSIEKEYYVIQQQQQQQQQHQQQQTNNEQQEQVCCHKANRPQSSLTTCGKFKEHLQNQPDQIPQQRRHINQIDQHYHLNDLDQQAYEKELVEELVDENNNLIETRSHQQQFKNVPQQQNEEAICCDHCRHHYLNGINVPLGSATSQNQIELNPLIGTRALANKQINQRLNDSGLSVKRNLKVKEQPSFQPQQQQQTNLVRSKSTHFQSADKQNDGTIPRMIVPGRQKPHKNMSHLKFEGDNCFVTTHNLMYRDHSMQNLSSNLDDERKLNRGVFAEKMMSNNTNKKSITGNIRGKVRNKYRDLFASSEDIFNNQNYPNNQTNRNNLSIKYKSAMNLPQALNEEQYYDQQDNEENYEYQNEYDGGEYQNYQQQQHQQDYQNAYYQDQETDDQQQHLDEEQIENEEQYDENDSQQRKLIFIPKNHPTSHLLNTSNFERRKDLSTTNSAYGSQLACPALDLTSDNKYEYKYTIGNHKYFTKKSSIS